MDYRMLCATYNVHAARVDAHTCTCNSPPLIHYFKNRALQCIAQNFWHAHKPSKPQRETSDALWVYSGTYTYLSFQPRPGVAPLTSLAQLDQFARVFDCSLQSPHQVEPLPVLSVGCLFQFHTKSPRPLSTHEGNV